MAPLRVSTTKSEWLPDDPTAFVPTRLWKLPFITTWDDSRNQNRPTDSAEEAEEHTRGHVLAVMLAYLIRRELSQAWQGLNVTVEEGLAQLATLCSMEVKVEGGASCLRIPTPRDGSVALLKAASVRAPEVLPHLETRV